MRLLRKISQRLTDPLFYRKRVRGLLRGFRSFDDEGAPASLGGLHSVGLAVAVLAHPDDEVFCSGLLCELKQRGARLRVLCLTKGEGGPRGEHPREELGRVRAEEMRRSCEVLGVDELVFLGHIDPEGRGYKVFAPEVSAADLAAQLAPHLEGTDLVVSHGSSGEYWHPAHVLVYEAVGLALGGDGAAGPVWLSFSARRADHPLPELVNWDDPAFLTLDASRHGASRLRALDCHRTQLGLFSKFAGGDHGDFIRYTAVESYALQRGAACLGNPKGNQDGG
jgi:LmbE family N-acetylglucosaminyl deacetylase